MFNYRFSLLITSLIICLSLSVTGSITYELPKAIRCHSLGWVKGTKGKTLRKCCVQVFHPTISETFEADSACKDCRYIPYFSVCRTYKTTRDPEVYNVYRCKKPQNYAVIEGINCHLYAHPKDPKAGQFVRGARKVRRHCEAYEAIYSENGQDSPPRLRKPN